MLAKERSMNPRKSILTRRQILALTALAPLRAAFAQTKAKLGGAPTAFSVRARSQRGGAKPFDILEHCHSLGLVGVETSLGRGDVKPFRQKAESYNLQVVLNTPLPRGENDVEAFDTAVAKCKEAGAIALHAAMTARRYEQFDSLEAFQKSFEQNQKVVA